MFMKSTLTIAGSDPTGGAGIQADLRAFAALGLHGASVIAAITAQNTSKVSHVEAVGAETIRQQLRTLLDDIRPDALKTGMLYSEAAVREAASAIRDYKLQNLVIDPVTISTSGTRLLEESAVALMKSDLVPLARVITPNMDEAGMLAGMSVKGIDDMEAAARAIRQMGPEVVIVTGGHLEDQALDVYFDGSTIEKMSARRLPGSFHGTGCAYSAFLAGMLALGAAPLDAARAAKQYVQAGLTRAMRPGAGMGILRP